MVEFGYDASLVGSNQLSKGAKFKLLATDFLQIDALFSKQINVGLLSPAARILLFITLSGSASVKDAKRVSGLSQRAFFQAYARLKDNGLVRVEPVPSDGRRKMLMLGDAFYTVFNGG
jgi:DNA-binding MarR family transcriptional regulator